MPRGDQTGPEGAGPMTGRGMGYCAGNDMLGYTEPGPGYAEPIPSQRGMGRRFIGRRFGGGGFRGRRHRAWFRATGVPGRGRFWPAVDPIDAAQESVSLKARAEWLRGELDAIDRRLGELNDQEK
jgi:hypothetical protein